MRGDAWQVEISISSQRKLTKMGSAAVGFNSVQEEGKRERRCQYLYDFYDSKQSLCVRCCFCVLLLVWNCKSKLEPLQCSEKGLVQFYVLYLHHVVLG